MTVKTCETCLYCHADEEHPNCQLCRHPIHTHAEGWVPDEEQTVWHPEAAMQFDEGGHEL